jgi:hypothetical protein
MPRVVDKGSYWLIEQTTSDILSDILPEVFKSVGLAIGRKRKERKEQEELQMRWAQLDPDLQRRLVDLMGEERIRKMLGQKAPKTPKTESVSLPLPTGVPETLRIPKSDLIRKRTPAEETEYAVAQQKAAGEAAEARKKVLEQHLREGFLDPNADPLMLARMSTVLRGGVLPGSDELAGLAMRPEELAAGKRAEIPGTAEYMQQARQKFLSEKMLQFPAEAFPALEQFADYMVGLTDEMPSVIPRGMEELKFEVEKQRLDLQRRQYNLDVQRVNLQTTKQITEAAQYLATNLPAELRNMALPLAGGFVTTGTLPEGVVFPPDLQAMLNIKKLEYDTAISAQKAAEAVVSSPKLNTLINLAQAAKDEKQKKDYLRQADVEFRRLYPNSPGQKGLWGSLWEAVKFGGVSSPQFASLIVEGAIETGVPDISLKDLKSLPERGVKGVTSFGQAIADLAKGKVPWKSSAAASAAASAPAQATPYPKPDGDRKAYIDLYLKMVEERIERGGLTSDAKRLLEENVKTIEKIQNGEIPYEQILSLKAPGGV